MFHFIVLHTEQASSVFLHICTGAKEGSCTKKAFPTVVPSLYRIAAFSNGVQVLHLKYNTLKEEILDFTHF